MNKIGIIGCGAWGTTISLLFHQNNHRVKIWCHNSEIAELINTNHECPLLKGIRLPDSIEANDSLESIVKTSDFLVLAVASSYVTILDQIKSLGSKPVLNLIKGLMENQESFFISDYLKQTCGPLNYALLSGPNLASEIARKLPSATVISSESQNLASQFQQMLSCESFRIYTSNDLRGVELGGILKNIMAIAAGVVDGLNLGNNAKSALMTRGLQEMIRFGVNCYNARKETFVGLSGLGDLITTCSSDKSRNWQVGNQLAKGKKLSEIQENMQAVAEGIKTTKIIYQLARENQVEMPITSQVYQVLYEHLSPPQAIANLMNRDLKSE
ncbi:NAD(P)H-dependent glycerol-3-phosphate dehydrogenase [Candidatus Margulisiibacteriota bacterium]